MTTASFSVLQAGPQVSVQDAGRAGMLRFGVPASGPMDHSAFMIANAALGNAPGAAGIEVSIGGLTLQCLTGAVSVAVAGGGFQVRLDDQKLGSWTIAILRTGSKLVIRPGPWGSWTYLAFAGDLRAGRWLSSAATHGPSGLGGGKLVAGRVIEIDNANVREDRTGPIPCPPWARPRHHLRAIPGPQDRFFSAPVLNRFLTEPFTLSDACDRMGARLTGPSLRPEVTLDMPSEAIVRGSVQVAGDGVATVLLSDHQTTGGYPKIATVLSIDVDGFSQLRSRDTVRFRAVDPATAIESRRQDHQLKSRYLQSLAKRLLTRPAGPGADSS